MLVLAMQFSRDRVETDASRRGGRIAGAAPEPSSSAAGREHAFDAGQRPASMCRSLKTEQ